MDTPCGCNGSVVVELRDVLEATPHGKEGGEEGALVFPIIVLVTVCSLIFQASFQGAVLRQTLHSGAVWLRQFVDELNTAEPQEKTPDVELESLVIEKMAETRASRFEFVLTYFPLASTFTLTLSLVARFFDPTSASCRYIPLCEAHVFLVMSSRLYDRFLNPWRFTIAFTLLTIHLVLTADESIVIAGEFCGMMMLVLLGCALLDHRFTAPINVSVVAAFGFRQSRHLPQSDLPFVIIWHSLSFVLIWLIQYLNESFTSSRLQAIFEAMVSDQGLAAARRLLSVLCDAQVILTAEKKVIDYGGLLVYLATEGLSINKKGNFEDHMSGEDKSRFATFISTVARDQSGSDVPAALHVQFCDDAGVRCSAKILCVQVAFLNGSHKYLIGVSKDTPQVDLFPAVEGGNIAMSSQGGSDSGKLFSASHSWLLQQRLKKELVNQRAASEPDRLAEDNMSSSTEGSCLSEKLLRVHNIADIKLLVDLFSPKKTIKRLVVNFCSADNSDDASLKSKDASLRLQEASINTWVKHGSAQACQLWIQKAVMNSLYKKDVASLADDDRILRRLAFNISDSGWGHASFFGDMELSACTQNSSSTAGDSTASALFGKARASTQSRQSLFQDAKGTCEQVDEGAAKMEDKQHCDTSLESDVEEEEGEEGEEEEEGEETEEEEEETTNEKEEEELGGDDVKGKGNGSGKDRREGKDSLYALLKVTNVRISLPKAERHLHRHRRLQTAKRLSSLVRLASIAECQ